MSYEGVICVLKPPGMSSSDAVTDVRRVLNEKRVGHTGTLDPAAAGVLPICVGRATRLFDFLVDKQKEYIAEVAFGKATDTEDAMGAVTSVSSDIIEAERLISVLPRFVGDIEQTPPVYSALSVNGEKLYKLARRGEISSPVESKKRVINIQKLELVRQMAVNRFLIRIVCSKGTYIRTLCKDIGASLGVPAYMAFLLRTRSGAFTLEESFSIAELAQLGEQGRLSEALIPMDKAIAHIPALRLTSLCKKDRRLLINGAAIHVDESRVNTPLRLYIDGEFIGMCMVDEYKMAHISVWLGSEDILKNTVLVGNVCQNRHIGTELGFPTANIEGYDRHAVPQDGVYATIAELDGVKYHAVTSVGTNPTVGGKTITVETHMIGYSGDCYGQRMKVRFVKKLRDMQRFESVEQLARQISNDIADAEHILETLKYTD